MKTSKKQREYGKTYYQENKQARLNYYHENKVLKGFIKKPPEIGKLKLSIKNKILRIIKPKIKKTKEYNYYNYIRVHKPLGRHIRENRLFNFEDLLYIKTQMKEGIKARDFRKLSQKDIKKMVDDGDYNDVEWNRYNLSKYVNYGGISLKDTF